MACANCSRAVSGRLAGCGAATATISGFVLVVFAIASSDTLLFRLAGGVLAMLFPALLFFLITCVLTGIPAALVIWLSEKCQMRSVLFFGSAGAMIGALSQYLLLVAIVPQPPGFDALFGLAELFAVAGLAAGVAYWRMAGRYVGGDPLR